MKLELELEDVNLILSALGQLPYIRVVDLIRDIQRQAREQIDTNEETADV